MSRTSLQAGSPSLSRGFRLSHSGGLMSWASLRVKLILSIVSSQLQGRRAFASLRTVARRPLPGHLLLPFRPMTRGVLKENLPQKMCVSCDRPFTWRKKWERCWDEVTTCSKSCNAARREAVKPRPVKARPEGELEAVVGAEVEADADADGDVGGIGGSAVVQRERAGPSELKEPVVTVATSSKSSKSNSKSSKTSSKSSKSSSKSSGAVEGIAIRVTGTAQLEGPALSRESGAVGGAQKESETESEVETQTESETGAGAGAGAGAERDVKAEAGLGAEAETGAGAGAGLGADRDTELQGSREWRKAQRKAARAQKRAG